MNKQQACEWIESKGGWTGGNGEFSGMLIPNLIVDGVVLNYASVSKPEYDQYLKDKADKMNLKDKTFTGNVSDWGLPDVTVIMLSRTQLDEHCYKIINGLVEFRYGKSDVVIEDYKIKSLPDGYQFNDAGEIVKVEVKRYWNGKEPLEVGMVVSPEAANKESTLALEKPDSEGWYCLIDEFGRYVMARKLTPIAHARSDKQKAIDDLSSLNATRDIDVIDAIIAGKIHGFKWVGKDE